MDSIKKTLRGVVVAVLRPGPPKPGAVVEELLNSLGVMPKHLHQLYKVFHALKQGGSDSMELDATQISATCLMDIVSDRKEWVERILRNLCQLSGCNEALDWDTFLYVTMRFCSLSKVELAQCMFYVIIKEVKSWTVHFVTNVQLQEFYDFYANCPVASFSTQDISFAKHFPLSRYYLPDFVELCHRFSQLINPAIHLQRAFQGALPSASFWNNYDRAEVFNRKITLDFFKIRKTHIFLRAIPPFRESCEMLLPETLGATAINEDQWKLRAPHYDPAQGVWPDIAKRVPGVIEENGDRRLKTTNDVIGKKSVSPQPRSKPLGAPSDGTRLEPATTQNAPERTIPRDVAADAQLSVQAVKRAMADTLGGAHPPPDGAPMGQLPKWIREYVTVPIRKYTTTRFEEVDFIASSRMPRTKARSQVDMMMQSNPRELLDRPQKKKIN